MEQLRTEIDIAAPPEEVWRHLTDLGSYAEWNPFITSAAGAVAVGARLSLRLEPPGGRAMTFRPSVTTVSEAQAFEWLGHLAVPGLFDGRHRFELTPTASGTRLVQSETFAGVLALLPLRKLAGRTRKGFEAMNEALRARVASE